MQWSFTSFTRDRAAGAVVNIRHYDIVGFFVFVSLYAAPPIYYSKSISEIPSPITIKGHDIKVKNMNINGLSLNAAA